MEVAADNTQILTNALERIKELKAHCERLRGAVETDINKTGGNLRLAAALEETPPQSLARIQREAITTAAWVVKSNLGLGYEQTCKYSDLLEYAEQLTKGSKE